MPTRPVTTTTARPAHHKPDWLSDAQIEDVCRTGIPGYDPWRQAGECRLDHQAARRAICFFSDEIRLTQGALTGKPFVLQRWQQAIVANGWGWMRPDGTRRYREILLYVGKKNGKTEFSAGLVHYMLLCDGEGGAKVFSAAASRDQAALVFEPAAAMIRRNPRLAARLRVYGDKGGGQRRAIVVKRDPSSAYVVLSADADTADGKNPHFAVVDELHRHHDGDLADVLQKSTAARRQPMVLYTTTADYDRPSLCNSMLRRARDVRDNLGDPLAPGWDPAFLPVIYEAGAKDDFTKVETWRKANPNLGVTVTEEFLRREAEKAVGNPSELSNFKRLHCNIVTEASSAAFDLKQWDACLGERVATAAPDPRVLRASYDALVKSLAGRRCYGGLDLASTRDLTAFVLYFPDVSACLSWFWVPRDTAARREREYHVPYGAWHGGGWLEFTDGDVCDYGHVEGRVLEIVKPFKLAQIAYDRYGASDLVQRLEKAGIEVLRFGQGSYSMSAPCKALEQLVGKRKLQHGGHPVLRWNAGNTEWEYDKAGSISPDKKRSSDKIDGIVALAMGIGASMMGGGTRQSVYNTRGAIVAGVDSKPTQPGKP